MMVLLVFMIAQLASDTHRRLGQDCGDYSCCQRCQSPDPLPECDCWLKCCDSHWIGQWE